MLLLKHLCRWDNDLVLVNALFTCQDSTLLPVENVLPADPQDTINIVVAGWESTVRDLEGPLNSELLSIDLVNFPDDLAKDHLERSLSRVVYQGTKGPHHGVLEDHVEPLSDLLSFD